MEASTKEISQQFSSGNFPFCYAYFADDIIWTIVGNKAVIGKEQVVAFCDKMMEEIASSTLNNTNIIAAENNIAIEGYCDYTDADNKACQIIYCDVYKFADDKISSITSYCIDKRL
jgi:limonene-1,2-epoxide hydrolase